jgi:hemerythrin-like domain-containing protein
MCDYCGCREVEPFAELSSEHEHLGLLGTELRTAVKQSDEARARVAMARVVEVLGPHVRKEERGIFAHVLDEAPSFQATIEGLIDEHLDLEAAIDRLDREPDWSAAAVALLDALDDHIYKEEWDLFPVAVNMLSSEALDAAAQVHAEEGSALTQQIGAR